MRRSFRFGLIFAVDSFMGTLKWIGGILGWATGGAIGALIGFILGSVAEYSLNGSKLLGDGEETKSAGRWQRATNAGGWQRATRGYSAAEQRNSFMISLLVLSSAVIRADGRTMHSEMEFVKAFIRRNFGEGAVQQATDILRELNTKNVDIYSVGAQIATYMNYSQRLQLFHYLAQLANADKNFCSKEKDVLEAIAAAIKVTSSDAASVIAMFYKDAESAYSVLEIPSTATDDEVKSAYRRMAMKNHPDKVATLGPDVQRAAAEKFRKVQEAYETIKVERGIN